MRVYLRPSGALLGLLLAAFAPPALATGPGTLRGSTLSVDGFTTRVESRVNNPVGFTDVPHSGYTYYPTFNTTSRWRIDPAGATTTRTFSRYADVRCNASIIRTGGRPSITLSPLDLPSDETLGFAIDSSVYASSGISASFTRLTGSSPTSFTNQIIAEENYSLY